MRAIAHSTGSRLVPALRYRDVAAAIDWLSGAFGFEKHDVVTAVDGTILHARLMFGSDMILVLPVRSADHGAARTPHEIGTEMQSCYFVVDDADLHYRHAKASGAEILDITEYDYGGRGYSCRDPEGHIWNFGTYDPRQTQAVVDHWPKPPSYWLTMASNLRLRTVAGLRSVGDKINPPVIVAAVVAAVIAAATVGWMLVALPQHTSGGIDKRLTQRSITPSQRTDEAAAAGRSQVNTLAIRAVAPQQSDDPFERAARAAPNPPSSVSSPTFAAIGNQSADAAHDPSKQTAERNAEEALRQLRSAQRTAGDAFRQLREASAEAASATPAPVEPRKQIARAVPDPQQFAREQQIAREQQLVRERERAAKESAALLQAQEIQAARERAVKEAAERARLAALARAPAAAPARPPQEQTADQPFWDCQPGPTGEIACSPAKKPAAAPEAKVPEAKAPPAPKPKVTAAEPAAASAPPARQPQADTRLWDCQPKPPTGEVVCRPMGAKQQ